MFYSVGKKIDVLTCWPGFFFLIYRFIAGMKEGKPPNIRGIWLSQEE